jgi:hypothetical protein
VVVTGCFAFFLTTFLVLFRLGDFHPVCMLSQSYPELMLAVESSVSNNLLSGVSLLVAIFTLQCHSEARGGDFHPLTPG